MSINESITVKDPDAAILATRLEETGNIEGRKHLDDDDYPAVDKSAPHTEDAVNSEEKGDYAGRKYDRDVEGPQQDSQETDEVYFDPRKEAGLPPAGKNVGDLTVDTLGRDDKS